MIKSRILDLMLVTTLVVIMSCSLLFMVQPVAAEESARNVVNIGVTNTINTMNPLLYDGTIVNTHAISLQYLPLVELRQDMSFAPQIASEISTEDNLTFHITIDEHATWSDGEPITSDDVIFTLLKLTSRGVGNVNVYGYSAFAGFDEGGQLDDDVKLEDVPSVKKLDDKNLTLTATYPIPLNTFLNSYMSYFFVVPSHVLGELSSEELRTSTWFTAPDVVSGPYRAVDVNLDHYASYEANENYWKDVPKIKNLNLKVVQGSGILAGLTSGEIDVVHPTMATVPIEDQAAIEELAGFKVIYDRPLTNNLLFINNESIAEVKVRKALGYAIDRALLLEGFLNGKGEVTEGFVTSYSPYFDESIEVLEFNPDAARDLLEEAGWDEKRELKFVTNSGDPIFANAANVIVQQLKAVGIKAKVQSMDIGSLLAAANTNDFDLLAVQYSFIPIDPILDIQFLVGSSEEGSNWSAYKSDEMNKLIAETLAVEDGDEEGLKEAYGKIDRLVQEDLPVISLYVQSPMGVVNDKLKNCVPSAYGFLENVQEWTFAE